MSTATIMIALSTIYPLSPHPMRLIDVILFPLANLITAIALLGPARPAWQMIRKGFLAPLAVGIHLYFGYFAVPVSYEDHWGQMIFSSAWAFRVLQHLVFFPAEDHCFRVKPRANDENGQGSDTNPLVLVAEPVPAPWTRARFYWAWSLSWSLRGIGWNYTPPLVPAANGHPFLQGSSRSAFVAYQLRKLLINTLAIDIIRTYMNVNPSASAFFSSHQPHYAGLTQWQRAVLSTCVALRTCLGIVKSFYMGSIFLVLIGGCMGWEGEMWSPWGYPPVFGSLQDTWRLPGVSTAWSRLWHQYYRHWLYVYGWVGIGEHGLRLARTGPDPKFPLEPQQSRTVRPSRSESPSPPASGRVSPSHPVPTRPAQRSSRYLTNLVKSLCVFALTGISHDYGFYFIMYFTNPHTHGKTWVWSDALVTTPFFVCQPLGIVLEAVVKKKWRAWKLKHRPEWTSGEPRWFAFCEQVFAFAWTWVFFGWTAGWYVDGVARTGMFKRDAEQVKYYSLVGGLVCGMWKH